MKIYCPTCHGTGTFVQVVDDYSECGLPPHGAGTYMPGEKQVYGRCQQCNGIGFTETKEDQCQQKQS